MGRCVIKQMQPSVPCRIGRDIWVFAIIILKLFCIFNNIHNKILGWRNPVRLLTFSELKSILLPVN